MAASHTKSPDPMPAGASAPPELPLSEWLCLALIDEGVNHGWAIGTELGADAELGRVWSLSRPLTYRAVEQLAAKHLIHREGHQRGQGRERMILTCTLEGKRAVGEWLGRPVAHLREVRTELLVKLVLRRRRGLDVESLLEEQQRSFSEHVEILTVAGPGAEVVDLWRRESARAVRRFLETALSQMSPVDQMSADDKPKERQRVRLSARNQLRARVTSVAHGEVMSTVKTVLPDGQVITAVITKDSVVDLDIAPDDEVVVVVKSTEVMLGKF